MPLHLLELVRRVTGVFKCLNISYIAIGQKDYLRLHNFFKCLYGNITGCSHYNPYNQNIPTVIHILAKSQSQ